MTRTFEIGEIIPVLDKGEVALIDVMGGDHKVYGSARISTKKSPSDSSKGEEADRKLIRFLIENGHGTPFEHAIFQWYVKAPIFVVREWQRHRIASYNEQSGRYASFEADFYIPDHVRTPDPVNKQSSRIVDDEELRSVFRGAVMRTSRDAFSEYEDLLASNVSREMARMVLPVNLYSRFWFTINARSLMNFLELRNSPDAQWEIREYARVLEQDFAHRMPWTYEAFIAAGRKAP